MRLSILICSLVERKDKLISLLTSLNVQIARLGVSEIVEVLFEVDNKIISTGKKRNNLLLKANGEYLCFCDDDDKIYDIYIEKILEAIESNPDCVATTGFYSCDGGRMIPWKLSKDYENHDGKDGVLYRKANHLTPVRREHALKAMFPDISNAEDKAYSEAINPYLKTETIITEPIYHYDYSSTNKSYK